MGSRGSSPSPYDDFGYIKDGKIFHLDGIEKGNDTSYWKELVNGGQFVGNAVRETNCYTFDNNTMDGPWGDGANDNYTVEICYHPTKNNVAIFGVSNSDTGYPLYVRISGKVTWLNRRKTYNVDSTLTYITSSFSVSLAVENGIELVNGSNDYWAMSPNNTTLRIGKGTSGTVANNYFTGDLYSIRIYNRQLSKAEMLNNQRVDNTRFNLGLTI